MNGSAEIGNPLDAKRKIVEEFDGFIKTLPDDDDPANVHTFLQYLQGILRLKRFVPPMVEIMSVLKQDKPRLFHAARRTVMEGSNLHILFQLDMNPEIARKRLDEIMRMETKTGQAEISEHVPEA